MILRAVETPALNPALQTSVEADRLWIGRVALTDFRNYGSAEIVAGPEPVVLVGTNGAGKTNLLEAISLLAPGNGLRRAAYPELPRIGGGGGWAVAARVNTRAGLVDIGTGQQVSAPVADAPEEGRRRPAKRIVRIDGGTASTSALADHVEMVWL